ncbi:hypothetical protein LPB72_03545 [Hydrogenophaga crassostreae]|uniref:Uncharacterized protein n=2 Tax=Hydrogenophaga crassostreae TaxID=1763535 RepID=A0A162Z4C9_9BURK|nr:hypothetical protein LPB072_17490 [Hydrogenophaga crassostreae]OAD43613.1 hypothetical protein LPB72_03545 [Hydrogenophaga crassostreae]
MHYLENNLVFQKSRLIDCLETDIMPIPEDEILEFFRLEESHYRKTIMDEKHLKSKTIQRKTIEIDVNYPEMATS